MISLFGTTDVLRVVTSSTANLDITGSYVVNTEPVTFGSIRQGVSSATTTSLTTAPGTSLKLDVYKLTIRNRHATTANTITLQIFDGTTAWEVAKFVLAAGEQAMFDGLNGWEYMNALGMPKTSQSQGSSSAAVSAVNLVVLAADVVNNNATLNTLQDVTGLSFPVIAGETYQFEFFIDYTAAATTTGSRWTINGPSFSRLSYTSDYGLTTTSRTLNNLVAYDQPAASNASSSVTTGNIAWMAGFITPSADGNVIARFASEIANSAITAKRGSLLKWTRTL